jgi:hypothetical protein
MQYASSAAKESAGQQRLHITPPVGNDIDDNPLADHTIDDAVGLEKNLPVFLVAKGP